MKQAHERARGSVSPLDRLLKIAPELPVQRQALLVEFAEALQRDLQVQVNKASDILTPEFVEDFSGRVIAYHAMHEEKMTKKTFEYVFCKASRAAGRDADITGSPVSPGGDVTVNGVKFSLKTEAAQGISRKSITISKLMEARWIRECHSGADFAKESTTRVGGHLDHYERMITLRAFDEPDGTVEYDLIEIPLELLRKVKDMKHTDFSPRTANGGRAPELLSKGRRFLR
jgi:hypothetical protein